MSVPGQNKAFKVFDITNDQFYFPDFNYLNSFDFCKPSMISMFNTDICNVSLTDQEIVGIQLNIKFILAVFKQKIRQKMKQANIVYPIFFKLS